MNQIDTQRVLLDSKDITMIKNSMRAEDAAMINSHRPNSLGWASGDGGFDASSAGGPGFT